MKIVISPAKSLDYNSELPELETTQPIFLKQAEILNSNMAALSKKAIGELMSISDKLADLNYHRYQDFSLPFAKENSRPAIYTFSGAVYTGLDIQTLQKEKIELLNDTLWILSGMYGILKPLDLMQAYRLEMGTKLKINGHKNLYKFWGNTITEALNKELKEEELFLNLASVEYFKVVNPKILKVPIISPIFKDYKNK